MNTFRQWVERGFEDITAGDATPYAIFVAACDAADAQTEAVDIAAIRNGVESWQAIAWLRERKSFARWGMKTLQLQGNLENSLAGKVEQKRILEPELAAQVLAALEEAGIASIPGHEHESGIPEEIIIEGRAQEAKTIEVDGGVITAVMD